MLVLSRKVGERILVGNDVWVMVCAIDRGKVRLGIDAPRGTEIQREENLTPDRRQGATARRETVRPDSELARARPLEPEAPAEEDADE
jgi:carbon storage regulator